MRVGGERSERRDGKGKKKMSQGTELQGKCRMRTKKRERRREKGHKGGGG